MAVFLAIGLLGSATACQTTASYGNAAGCGTQSGFYSTNNLPLVNSSQLRGLVVAPGFSLKKICTVRLLTTGRMNGAILTATGGTVPLYKTELFLVMEQTLQATLMYAFFLVLAVDLCHMTKIEKMERVNEREV